MKKEPYPDCGAGGGHQELAGDSSTMMVQPPGRVTLRTLRPGEYGVCPVYPRQGGGYQYDLQAYQIVPESGLPFLAKSFGYPGGVQDPLVEIKRFLESKLGSVIMNPGYTWENPR